MADGMGRPRKASEDAKDKMKLLMLEDLIGSLPPQDDYYLRRFLNSVKGGNRSLLTKPLEAGPAGGLHKWRTLRLGFNGRLAAFAHTKMMRFVLGDRLPVMHGYITCTDA